MQSIEQKDHVRFFTREKRIKYNEQMKAEVDQDMELFRGGLLTGYNEDYDFLNREVVVIPYNNPNEYIMGK
jgi:hypothetical protein